MNAFLDMALHAMGIIYLVISIFNGKDTDMAMQLQQTGILLLIWASV
jgi:hypothetical protein